VLEHCDVVGDADLFGLTVAADAAFIDCSFATIHAEYAAFGGVVRFVRCTIAKLAARAARFERGLSFNACDLEALEVTGHAAALNVVSCRVGDFRGAQIGVDSDVILTDSTFRTVQLNAARIGGELRITGVSAASFNGDLLSALALNGQERTRIGDASFVAAELKGGCSLLGAELGSLVLHGLGSAGPLSLAGSRLGSLRMTGAHVGPVTLTQCTVDQHLAVAHAHLGSVAITGTFADFRIEDSEIAGTLQIAYATFGGDLVLQRNTLDVLALNSPWKDGQPAVAVTGMANLFGNVVASQIQIKHVNVGTELRLTDTRAAEVLIDGVTAGSDIDVTMSRIDGGLTLFDSSAKGTITLAALHAGPVIGLVKCTAAAADLSGMVVDGDVLVDACSFDELRMSHARAGGTLSLQGSSVARELTLTGTSAAELTFDPELGVAPAAGAFSFPPRISLRGCTYGTLNVVVPTLVAALATQTRVDGGTFAALQKYLRDLGRQEDADSVLVTWRRRSKRQIAWSSPRRAGSELLDLLSAYGTQPWRLLWAVAILLVLVFIVTSLPDAVVTTATPPVSVADPSLLDRLRLTIAVAIGGEAATIGGNALSSAPLVFGVMSPSEWVTLLRDVAIALVAIVAAYLTGFLRYPEDR
jgi:hypothetical protein